MDIIFTLNVGAMNVYDRHCIPIEDGCLGKMTVKVIVMLSAKMWNGFNIVP